MGTAPMLVQLWGCQAAVGVGMWLPIVLRVLDLADAITSFPVCPSCCLGVGWALLLSPNHKDCNSRSRRCHPDGTMGTVLGEAAWGHGLPMLDSRAIVGSVPAGGTAAVTCWPQGHPGLEG